MREFPTSPASSPQRSFRSLLAALGLLLAGAGTITGAVAAGPALPPRFELGEDAMEAVNRGDYAVAIRIWQAEAARGSADAQYHLGVLALNGLGREASSEDAAQWFRAAAAQGQSSAQYNLGLLLMQAGGPTADRTEAVQWFTRAAAAGHPRAREMARLLGRDDAIERLPARLVPKPAGDAPVELARATTPPPDSQAPRAPRRPATLAAVPPTGLLPDRQHGGYAGEAAALSAAVAAAPAMAAVVPATTQAPLPVAADPAPPVEPPSALEQVSPVEPVPATPPAVERPSPRPATGPVAPRRIQLGSLPEREQAERELARLWRKHADLLTGIDGHVEAAVIAPDRTTFRIRSGALPTALPADQLCAQLTPRGERCMVTR